MIPKSRRGLYWLDGAGVGISQVPVTTMVGKEKHTELAVALYREINDMNPILIRREDLVELVRFLNALHEGELELPVDLSL